MEKERIITCTYGFNFKFTKNITKADFVLMSKVIANNLNYLYNTSDYEVIPEAISKVVLNLLNLLIKLRQCINHLKYIFIIKIIVILML